MASYGDDATLMKVAVFGITVSIMCTLGISLLLVENGDYDYEDIQAYRNDLISFSGEGMVNNSPWVLTHVYTPWNTSLNPRDHYDDGWLYGEDLIESYPDKYKSADIHMNPQQKSSVPISFTREVASYQQQDGTKWWANIPVINYIGEGLGFDPYTYKTVVANNWNFTGYRYVMDPTLPFAENQTSTRDGSLSLVWYSYGGQEGLSGGLDIYGGEIKLASYSATDIIADYNESSSYATVYDFDFTGTHLNLSIRFDPNAIENGTPLMEAWSNGQWSFAVSSISAGNYLDIENSATFANSVGSTVDTFIKIFTFSVPDLGNSWAGMILWLMCGLPMTIAMLCVSLRLISAAKPLGG
jgi:hypothetical protein